MVRRFAFVPPLLAAALATISGCGRIGFDPTAASPPPACESPPIDPTVPTSLAVGPRYAVAPDWNDYVVAADPNAPCRGDEPHALDCLHGGELRRVEVPDYDSCVDLTLEERLEAFEWECIVEDGRAVFVSVGLRAHRGLSHLVDESGWLDNSVVVLDQCAPVAASPPAAWWDNTVRSLGCLPEPGGESDPSCVEGVVQAREYEGGPTRDGYQLVEEGTVYVVPTDRRSSGLFIGAPKASLVVLPGSTLTYQSIAGRLNCATGGTPASFRGCLASTGGQSFVWIEGRFDAADTATYAVNASGSSPDKARFVTLRNVYATGAGLGPNASGVFIQFLAASRLSHVTSAGNDGPDGGAGIRLRIECTGNVFTDLVVADNPSFGMHFAGGTDVAHADNTVSGLVALHNGRNGLHFDSAECTNIMGGPGCTGRASVRSTFTDVVGAFNADHAIHAIDATDTTFARITAVGNRRGGTGVVHSSGVTIFELVSIGGLDGVVDGTGAMGSLYGELAFDDHSQQGIRLGGTGARFVGRLLMGDNGTNCAPGGTDNVLMDDCTGPDHVLTTGIDLSSALVGPTDSCVGPVGLGISDVVTDPRALFDDRLREASGPLARPAFSAGAPCPITGDDALTDLRGQSVLLGAREVFGDGIGDDDGLCETSETCAYTGRVGAGPVVTAPVKNERCVFTGGLVDAVTLVEG